MGLLRYALRQADPHPHLRPVGDGEWVKLEDVAALVYAKIAELEEAVIVCDEDSADYCSGAFNAVENLRKGLGIAPHTQQDAGK